MMTNKTSSTRLVLIALLLLISFTGFAQGRAAIEAYIQNYRHLAIEEMKRTGVPAAIKLAQGIHETTAGTSNLVLRSNNHFGIKCKSNWTGESVSHTDDAPDECFRKYPSADQSYRDHSDFLKNSQRYAALFKLKPEDYKGWAHGLKKAGYATNPKYPALIIKLIEEYGLQEYTLMALGKKEIPYAEWATQKTEQSISNPVNPGTVSAVTAAVIVVENNEGDSQQNDSPTQENRHERKRPTYAKGEFKINDTRVIYAPEGTSMLGIAMKYDIALKRLYDFNDMKEQDILKEGQLIFLQRKRRVGDGEYHTVQTGETLYEIAQQRGIRMEALLEYNHLMEHMRPAAGSHLNLRKKASGPPALTTE